MDTGFPTLKNKWAILVGYLHDGLGVAREESGRLYRFSVTGKPDLNRMETSIDMGENDLNNTITVNAVTGKFSSNVIAGNKVTAEKNIRTKMADW